MGTSQTLYKDFQLTLENCHEEPIHRPIAIQGHGHMLVFTGSEDIRLHAVSERFASLIERETDSLWDEMPEKWLPGAFKSILAEAPLSNSLCSYSGHWEAHTGETFDVIHSHNDDCVVLELEPVKEAHVNSRVLPEILKKIRAATNPTDLYQVATSAIASLFCFDRVMVYQFDEDKHGCVVGEHKRDDLEAYLGLHYPESDIPKIARDMFLQVRSRLISDIHVRNESLLFNPRPDGSRKSPYLDLTYSQLRAISPVHIEYLGNMGVQSTMTLSLVVNGKLWGLIACHHYSPRLIRFDARATAEVIGDLIAKRIAELEASERQRIEMKSRAVENSFLDKVRLSEDYRIDLLEYAHDTSKMCKADGVALVTLDDVRFSTGLVPEKSILLSIRDWLVDNEHDEVYSTSEFNEAIRLDTTDTSVPIGGMLVSCLSNISNSYLLWFRAPVSQSVFWAGDPEKNFSIDESKESGELRLSPRQSFAKWQVVVEGQSERWEPSALQMALRVREGLVRKELLYTANLIKRSNEDFMQLTYAAVHDLQEPLRTQSNYLELMQETLGSCSEEEQKKYLSATMQSADRMRELITDLLSFASINTENSREVICLEDVVSELKNDLASAIQRSGATVHVGELVTIQGDHQKIRQLILNLLTNALKYVDTERAPVVQVYIEKEGVFYNLCIQDNGIGIDERYFGTIFKLFQRLHRKSEYSGTGIGLATCKKIADSIGTSIGVESVVGQGSIFRVKLHKSIIID